MSEAPHEPGPVRCPRCGADLTADQDWCLRCGTAARTVIAATPGWRLPIALLAIVVVLSGAAAAWAFVALTDNDDEVRAATAQPTTPAVAPPTTPPSTASPPASPTTAAPAAPAAPAITAP